MNSLQEPLFQRAPGRRTNTSRPRFRILFGVMLGILIGAGCNGSHADDPYQRAEQYWHRQMYGLAAQSYEQFAARRPDDPKAAQSLYKAGFIYAYYLSDYPRAVQLFHRLIALHPESPYCLQAHKNLAENYETRLRQYPQAIAQYRRVIELERREGKDVSPYCYEVGRCYFMMGDPRQALEVYQRICKETPKGEYADSAAYQIGFLQFLDEDWEAAEKSFRFLLENYPDSQWTVDAMLNRARCLRKLGRTAAFDSLYREIRKRFPERASDLDLEKPAKRHGRRR